MGSAKRKVALNRRPFYVMFSSLIVLIILTPIIVYWAEQRIETHASWDNEINYAQLFRMHVDTAADAINGTFYPWNNESSNWAGTELNYGGTTMFFLGDLDYSHRNQLSQIANNVLASTSTFYQITALRRVTFSTNLRSLGNEIVNAYFVNSTEWTAGVGPPFWYSGPSPPNEQDLQAASIIAANLTG